MAGHPHTTESKLKLSNSMKGKGHKPIPIGSRFGMLTVISGPHRSCNTMKRNMSYDEFIQYFLKLYHNWGYLYVGVIVCVEDEERV